MVKGKYFNKLKVLFGFNFRQSFEGLSNRTACTWKLLISREKKWVLENHRLTRMVVNQKATKL